jgi:endonuclease YncB( thermonuclease family)
MEGKREMKKIKITGGWMCPRKWPAIACFGLAIAFSGVSAAETLTGRIVSVLDGDTVILLDGQQQQHRIRLAEIDAPEKTQAFGQRSKQSLSELAYGREATANCQTVDRYGRSLCRITVGGVDVNLDQVQRGMAWAYDRYARDPRIFAAQREARAQRRGLWAEQGAIPPWEYRKQDKR